MKCASGGLLWISLILWTIMFVAARLQLLGKAGEEVALSQTDTFPVRRTLWYHLASPYCS